METDGLLRILTCLKGTNCFREIEIKSSEKERKDHVDAEKGRISGYNND
jgi:hypothetical protein